MAIHLAGKPLVAYVVEAFLHSAVDELVIVGSESKQGSAYLPAGSRIRFLVNPDARSGMASSLGLALGAARGKAAVIGLGDQPLLLPSTIDRIIAAYQESGAKIVIPVCRGTRGNPVLIDRTLFPLVMEIRGDRGARSVVAKNPGLVQEVDVLDGGVLIDVDTPADLEVVRKKMARRRSVGGAPRK